MGSHKRGSLARVTGGYMGSRERGPLAVIRVNRVIRVP
jgi:hypothetical protein